MAPSAHAQPTEPSSQHRRTGVPRWATVIGLLAALALVLYMVTMLLGGGHGPSRHAPVHSPTEPAGVDADQGSPGGERR